MKKGPAGGGRTSAASRRPKARRNPAVARSRPPANSPKRAAIAAGFANLELLLPKTCECGKPVTPQTAWRQYPEGAPAPPSFNEMVKQRWTNTRIVASLREAKIICPACMHRRQVEGAKVMKRARVVLVAAKANVALPKAAGPRRKALKLSPGSKVDTAYFRSLPNQCQCGQSFSLLDEAWRVYKFDSGEADPTPRQMIREGWTQRRAAQALQRSRQICPKCAQVKIDAGCSADTPSRVLYERSLSELMLAEPARPRGRPTVQPLRPEIEDPDDDIPSAKLTAAIGLLDVMARLPAAQRQRLARHIESGSRNAVSHRNAAMLIVRAGRPPKR